MKPSPIARAALALTVMLAASMPIRGATIDAVWKPQRATFVYYGHTTKYTCDGLRKKVAVALRVLGAHDSVAFERSECIPGRGARLHVTFKSPIEATEANILALTTYTAEDVLAARVRSVPLPRAEDFVRFPAEWSEISFARDRRLRMTRGDCELVDSIRRQLIPQLSARVTTNRLFCTPGELGLGPPKLVVSALVAVDARTDASAQASE